MSGTSFEDKVEILADLWIYHREEEEFEDLIEYADLGFPLAYARQNDMVQLEPAAVEMINEAFDLLLGALGVEDSGFTTLDGLLGLEDYEIPIADADEDEEEEEEYETWSEEPGEGYAEGFNDGFEKGVAKEQERIQAIVIMQKRWAKENRKGNEFLFWDSVGEVITPINFEYDEEEYKKSLEQDGF